jgi:hypothetical protein
VRVDAAREHELPGRVDDAVGLPVQVLAYLRDRFALDQDVGDPLFVRGDDTAVKGFFIQIAFGRVLERSGEVGSRAVGTGVEDRGGEGASALGHGRWGSAIDGDPVEGCE